VTETIEPMAAQIDQQQLAQELVEQARADGVELVGAGGLLTRLTKSVLANRAGSGNDPAPGV
jgi:putative transposase